MTQLIGTTEPKRPRLSAEAGDSKGCLPFILLMFTFLVIMMVIAFFIRYLTSTYLHEDGIGVEARVISKAVGEACGEGGCSATYLIEYLFITQNEQQITGKEYIDRTQYEATPIGGGWPVVYLRSEPTTYESRYHAIGFVTRAWEMVYWFSFGYLILLTLWLVEQLRKRHFQRKSKLIQGVVTQRWKTFDEEYNYHYFIAYTFPGGAETQATLLLNRFQQVKVGSPIVVRYLPGNPRRSHPEW